MVQRPPVSVVVPFLGSDSALEDLVARLGRIEVGPGDELIIADNRTTDPGSETPGPVVRHPSGGVHSPGFARNRGAARATGDWIVFIDADTEPDRGLLNAYFEPAPAARTAILGGRIVDLAVPATPAGRITLSARRAEARGHLADRVTLERPAFPYAQSANCAILRSAFTAAGGFDESVRAGEDADLCFRLAADGRGLEARPAAIVHHRTRATLSRSLAQLSRHGAGAAWCNRRHPGSFPPPTALGFAGRLGASAGRAATALLAGDREPAAFDGLEILEALAFEAGRLLPNTARR